MFSVCLMVTVFLVGGLSLRSEPYAPLNLQYGVTNLIPPAAAPPVDIEGLPPNLRDRKIAPGDPAVQIAFRDFFGPQVPTPDRPLADNIVPPLTFSLPSGTELTITALPISVSTTACSFLFWSFNLQTSFDARIDIAFSGDTTVIAWYDCTPSYADAGPVMRVAAFDLKNDRRLDGVKMAVTSTGKPDAEEATLLSVCRLGETLLGPCPQSGKLLQGTLTAPSSAASAGSPDLAFEEWAVGQIPVSLAGNIKPSQIGLQAATAIAFYKPLSARLTIESNLDALLYAMRSGSEPQSLEPQLKLRLGDTTNIFSVATPFDALRSEGIMLTLSGERNLTLPQTPSAKASATLTFESMTCDSASGPIETSVGSGDTEATWERTLATPTIPPLPTFQEDTTCRVVYTTQAP